MDIHAEKIKNQLVKRKKKKQIKTSFFKTEEV